MFIEVMSKEEVSILIVLIGTKLKRLCLHTTLRRDMFCLCLLPTDYHIEVELTKLHFGLNTKERGSTTDQGVSRLERYITSLHQFYDIVFFPFIGKF